MSQLDIKKLNILIGEIYQSALETDFWPCFLGTLQEALNARSIVLGFGGRSVDGNRLSIDASVDFDVEFGQSYNDHYWKKNLLLKKATAKGLFKPGTILKSQELVSSEQLEKSEFFNKWMRPQDIRHVWAPVITLADSFVGTLTISRQKSVGDFSEEEESFLRLLMPHIQRAFDQYKVFSGAKIKSDALLDSLGQVATAVLMIGADRRILEANDKAMKISELNDGICIGASGKLEALDIGSQMKLSKLISTAVDTSQGRTIIPGGLIRVERPSGKRPFTVTVSPIARLRGFAHEKTPYATVFILDPDDGGVSSVESLKELYGLTPAEARLALILVSGTSLDEAAQQLEVKKNTVRTLLQRVYYKTNTNRQGELISLLLRGTLPPV